MGTLKSSSKTSLYPPSRVEICLPWSKSHVNRILLIDALAKRNPERLAPYCDSNDSAELLRSLQSKADRVNSGEGATPLRFLLAYRAAMNLPGRIDVSGTMQQRQVGSLVDALNALGADIRTENGYAPIHIHRGIDRFDRVTVDAQRSSQAVSALLLLAPLFPGTKTIHTPGGRISESYVAMSAACLEREGIRVETEPEQIRVMPGTYKQTATEPVPERDWSAAAFFLSLAIAMPGTEFHFPGLTLPSLQGDARALSYWQPFGMQYRNETDGITCQCHPDLRGPLPESMDFADVPDLVPAWIIAAAVRTNAEICLTGTAHLSDKESNRMQRMAEGLAGWDINLSENKGHWVLDTCNRTIRPLCIQTGGDHRIAMAFSTAAALTAVELDDLHCVAKSFPGFFNELEACNLSLQEKPV
jgi:3-phosphoshikimate 1-carboxyvinyltransferase